MSTERVPCSKCGASILSATFERTDGVCMPCSRAREQPAILESDPNAEFSILYSVNPSWGRLPRVYLLSVNAGGGLLQFQSWDNLPETLRRGARDSLRIFQEHPVSTKRLELASSAMIKDYVEALALPVLGEFTGGFDGTDYMLRISKIRTISEFRWWTYLPERWLPLLEIINIIAEPFVTNDCDDRDLRTTVERDQLTDSEH